VIWAQSGHILRAMWKVLLAAVVVQIISLQIFIYVQGVQLKSGPSTKP
jgi:hypothetical protein